MSRKKRFSPKQRRAHYERINAVLMTLPQVTRRVLLMYAHALVNVPEEDREKTRRADSPTVLSAWASEVAIQHPRMLHMVASDLVTKQWRAA
jgi:hypothetical protein